jgi:hypothetical protein
MKGVGLGGGVWVAGIVSEGQGVRLGPGVMEGTE